MAALYEDISGSRYLSSSISSLSASRQQSSQIAKAYRQAAQLFLTRRLPEALSTIEPIITAPARDDGHGSADEVHASYAPVATASRGTRVKVWSFYLTFLNSVVELGADEGKHAFGSARWKQLVARCRDGSVWEDVVRDGYGGVEGDVDADVVVNLSTLLLTHSPSQRLNQSRLETYLSATANPTFDIASHLSSPSLQRRKSHTGTDTPRDLNTRIKLLELYTLHVLPRNDEWDYAREFVTMSEVLDDERKEAFLLALHSLKEEKEDSEAREEKLRQQQQEQLEERRRETEARQLEQARLDDDRRRRDDEATTNTATNTATNRRKPDDRRNPHPQPQPQPPSSRASRTPAKKPAAPPPSLPARLTALVAALQKAISDSARHATRTPFALVRTLLFVLALGLAVGKRDLRQRIMRVLRQGSDKLRRTVGMGVKVSYI
ncbi:hypothetical protein M3J09_012186 [Ascochyta lentis]